jgi:hypothetical protein
MKPYSQSHTFCVLYGVSRRELGAGGKRPELTDVTLHSGNAHFTFSDFFFISFEIIIFSGY